MPAATEEKIRAPLVGQATIAWTLVTGFSILYFVDVLVRAATKYFWYDELFTFYACRLPNFHALWAALAHGADLNPPGFYLIAAASRSIFGEGLIAMRLPEILAFWIFSLCLFRFVSRRCGPLAGFAAMALPSLTGAFYYSYEARPHAIVLGFCGIALISWQMATEKEQSRWKVAFGLSLFGALMMHPYSLVLAVPFTIAELFRTRERRQVDWRLWMSIVLPVAGGCAVNLPLLLTYRKAIRAAVLPSGKDFSDAIPASLPQVGHFYQFLITPCALVIVLVAVVLAVGRIRGLRTQQGMSPISAFPKREIVLGLALMGLPLYGVALGELIHAPFFARYFLSALGGVCVLLGLGLYSRKPYQWVPVTAAVIVAFALTWQTGQLLRHWRMGWGDFLYEPSSRHLVSTGAGQPLDLYGTLIDAARNSTAPILVMDELDFFYLVHYAPAMEPRLFYAAARANENFKVGFETVRHWLPVQFNPPLTFADFLERHGQFLVLGNRSTLDQLIEIEKTGAKPTWIEGNDIGQFVALMKRTDAAAQ